jgi:DNA-binding XRE family transcriptional regulator
MALVLGEISAGAYFMDLLGILYQLDKTYARNLYNFHSEYGGCPVLRAPHLRMLREQRALSQSDLAERSRVTQVTISRIENGKAAHPGTVRKLAEALGVEPGELMGAAES